MGVCVHRNIVVCVRDSDFFRHITTTACNGIFDIFIARLALDILWFNSFNIVVVYMNDTIRKNTTDLNAN